MDFLSNPTAGFVSKRTTPVAGERVTLKAAQNAATTGNWLDAGDAAGLRVTQSDSFIIAGWVKVTATTQGYILTKGEDFSTVVDEYSLYVNDTTLVVTFNVATNNTGSSAAIDSTALTVNTKSFLVAWVNDADGTINIQLDNGTINSIELTRSSDPATGGNFVMFANDAGDGSVGLKAVLDEWFFCKNPPVMADALTLINSFIYNSGNGNHYDNLTANQITTLGLVSWWGMDEASAATRKDLNSTNDLTLNGTITQVAPLTV